MCHLCKFRISKKQWCSTWYLYSSTNFKYLYLYLYLYLRLGYLYLYLRVCVLDTSLQKTLHSKLNTDYWMLKYRTFGLLVLACPLQRHLRDSFSLMAYSYWSIAVSIRSCHCWWSAVRCQAEWMPMLNGWTSLETVLSQVSQGRPLGLLHPVGGLLIAATRTLWWSSLSGLLARWLKSWSLRMRTSLEEAAEQPVTRLTSTFATWRVYGMRRIFLRHHMSKASILRD